ncbi:MAG: helix-turn-helix domain-containing protein [Agathobacter sp.]|nr:helix-turn-helix domain-containing protein [Agathobacter sp.]
MNQTLLQILREVTREEELYRDEDKSVEKAIYSSDKDSDGQMLHVDAQKILDEGKLIQIRTHTRFVHFPVHTHNYVEMVYMCQGSTHHIISGNEVILKEGELLLISQSAKQEIYPAKETDVAVNFIVLPEFFDYGLTMMSPEENQLRSFVIDCLTGAKEDTGYLHFKVSDILPIQNLIENLIWTLVRKEPNKRSIQQATMGLLFLQLMNQIERMETAETDKQQKLVMDVLSYIEEHYRDGDLETLAKQMHYDMRWLSKEIKKRTGLNYTDLLQNKRLNQAAYLLVNTNMNVMDIGLAVGYDNTSYFHRIFQKQYGMTPRQYRVKNQEKE